MWGAKEEAKALGLLDPVENTVVVRDGECAGRGRSG